MSVTTDLFVGLVTHRGTRFPHAAEPEGVLASVVRAARGRGLTVASLVSEEDAFDDSTFPVSRQDVLDSIAAELAVEERWRSYLSEGRRSARLRMLMAARRTWRRARLAPAWKGEPDTADPGPRMVRRLANIEASHLRVLHAALASGATWSLVLEDDAGAADASAFAEKLVDTLTVLEAQEQPLMVNLSESFSHEALGIEDLLAPVGDIMLPWHMLAARKPVTNTVCAVLYRRLFLERLTSEITDIALRPVIPIDFKFNEALMRLSSACRPGDVWLASPGPLHQLSGVPDVWA